MAKKYEVVNTWADGFGIWHATVTDIDYRHCDTWATPGRTDNHIAGMRRAARKAIMAEILERSPRGTIAAQVRLTVKLDYFYTSDTNRHLRGPAEFLVFTEAP